ncbi:MAG: ATP-dependent Clp protease proteolytic subunit [Anaerolineae bacterium]|nr:ATP-dependent Clp protease proteolytic subunit [Thermoflexus sp.]MDW8064922.1 ATP-dependent Clp protease proteolytic subunit [Anaerolineae bacterium]
MSVFDLFWVFLIFSAMFPAMQRRLLEEARARLIRQIERRRGTRLITMIHRQETIGFFGLPISRYIDIEDSELVLRAIRLTPPNMPIDLILHTPGGLVLAAEQIAQALVRHPAKVTVFVPHYAMSGGTLIALAADEIVMDENAVLGPVDPQLGQYPAASILRVVESKPLANIEDHTLILADIARKAMEQTRSTVIELLTANGMDAERAGIIVEVLTSGRWTHDYPISVQEAQAMGLPVQVGLPEEIYQLMDMFPQATPRRPSVEYIPIPYRHESPTHRLY